MKKFLLSLAVLALGANVMNAEELNVNDATDFQGTLVEEVAASGNNSGTAKHYQPLNSFKIGDYTFTTANGGNEAASNQPAYYYNMSSSTNTQNTVRLYKSNTLTISSNVAFGKVVIKAKSITAINETNKMGASVGGFTINTTDKTLTWINSDAVTSVTFSIPSDKSGSSNPSLQIISFEISSETGTTPDPVEPTGSKIVKSTTLQTGKVAFIFDQGYVSTFAESSSYGYFMATAATLADEMTVPDAALFTLASTDNGYTITDCYGRIIGWDGSHWSFNAYSSASEGNSYWDATMEDGKIKLSNKSNSAVYLCGKTYSSDYEMCPTDRADQTLPYLYVVSAPSGVAELEAEEAGEAVYYNLQGVKVAEPENGLYIKVQGKKATKVMVRK